MKKIYILIITGLFLTACKSQSLKSFEGDWIDKENEMTEVTVSNADGVHWLEFYNGKYKISSDKKVQVRDKEFSIALVESQNVLVINGNEYIPKDDALKYKFIGTWKGPEGTTFEISLVNGGLKWIVRNSMGEAQYYPKKQLDGYSFTYNEEDLKFLVSDDCILDSLGNQYCKA